MAFLLKADRARRRARGRPRADGFDHAAGRATDTATVADIA